jgi:hypothetical protein
MRSTGCLRKVSYSLTLRMSTLTLDPSPSGRGTSKHTLVLLPFSMREKGPGDEGWCVTSIIQYTA